MAELKVEIPDDLKKEMSEFKLNWSEAAARAISDKTEKLKKLKRFSSKVKVPDKAAKEFTDKLSEAAAKRFREAKEAPMPTLPD